MSINQKKCNILMQIVFFAFPLVCLQNSFALEDAAVNIKSTQSNPSIMAFKTPGEQTLTIKNYLQKDIAIGNAYFVGNKYNAQNIGNNVHIKSIDGCSTIKARTSCTFGIKTEENASPSVNSNGDPLLINYAVQGEKGNRFAQVNIKLDYNNDVIFKVRNVEFTRKSTLWMEDIYYDTQKLVIMNNNPAHSVNIKNVELAERNEKFKYAVRGFNKPLVLKSNDSCEVEIGIMLDAQNDVIPIYVTYDVVDESNVVVKKDLIATAVAIVKHYDDEEPHLLRAIINGAITAASIVLPYNDFTQKVVKGAIKDIFVAVLPTKIVTEKVVGVAADVFTGPAAGLSYFAGDKLSEKILGKYNSEYGINKIFSATAMYGLAGAVLCFSAGGPLNYGYCVAYSTGAGLEGTFFGQLLTEMLFSTVEHPLPEQSWSGWGMEKAKLPFNFIASAFARKSSKIILGVSKAKDGVIPEMAQDGSSAVVMDAVVERGKQNPDQEVASTNFTSVDDAPVYDDYSGRNEYVCADLPPESEENNI
jgi:hypothetical protein